MKFDFLSTALVSMLLDDPRTVHNHDLNAVPMGHMLRTMSDGKEVVAPPAHVVDVGCSCHVVRLD